MGEVESDDGEDVECSRDTRRVQTCSARLADLAADLQTDEETQSNLDEMSDSGPEYLDVQNGEVTRRHAGLTDSTPLNDAFFDQQPCYVPLPEMKARTQGVKQSGIPSVRPAYVSPGMEEASKSSLVASGTSQVGHDL